MNYQVISSRTPEGLNNEVRKRIEDGWKPVGSHQVVTHHIQNRFRGTEHVDSVYENEYTQTMIKEE